MKFVKISWEKYERDCIKLAKKLKDRKINKIVAISRGGLVIARILSDLLTLPISHITIVSYANLKQEKEPVITEAPTKIFKNESIMIVDDVCDTGKTFERALNYFKNLPLKKIYTLALYLKPWSKFIPDFYWEKFNAWIVFPYELKETADAFLKMYKTKKEVKKKLGQIGLKDWEIAGII